MVVARPLGARWLGLPSPLLAVRTANKRACPRQEALKDAEEALERERRRKERALNLRAATERAASP
jgi:hypothetical protein